MYATSAPTAADALPFSVTTVVVSVTAAVTVVETVFAATTTPLSSMLGESCSSVPFGVMRKPLPTDSVTEPL